jgi:SOS response regulatory protein OraA/RecX
MIRVRDELRKKGIPEVIIRDTISSLKGEFDEKAMVIKALEAKLRRSGSGRMNEKEKRKIIQHLSGKGFHINTIYEVLKNKKFKVFEDEGERG